MSDLIRLFATDPIAALGMLIAACVVGVIWWGLTRPRIGASGTVKVSRGSGTSGGRVGFFLLWVFGPPYLVFSGLDALGLPWWASLFVGLPWGGIVLAAIKSFLVIVPEYTGLVTMNLFGGRLRAYGTGWHLKYPWEQAPNQADQEEADPELMPHGNYINLRLVLKREFLETYLALNNVPVIVKWSLQFRPTIKGLPLYIGVDDATIEQGFKDIISSIVTTAIGKINAEDVKSNIKNIEKELFDALNLEEGGKPKPGEPHPLEVEYGIDITRFVLADADTDERYKNALMTVAVAEKMNDAVKKFGRGIDPQRALNAVLLKESSNTKKTVFEFEDIGKLAGAIARLIRGIFRPTT